MQMDEQQRMNQGANKVAETYETNVEEPAEAIHLPSPSWAPIILALGLTGVCFGIVLSAVVLAVGIVLLLTGLGLWVYDEIQHAAQEDAEGQHAEGAL